nr:reverse transcriptase domain-containing protein [Tanacetum cinerariifolium]
MRVPNVPSSSIKLMLFPFSLKGAAWIWLEKEPARFILTWDDLVSKFINQFFPPSRTIKLYNEIMRFQKRFDESFYEAWDRFNDLLRACPHHGFSELHQLDTFYNALKVNDQDSLSFTASGNFLDKMPRECLKIIESRTKVRQSRAKAVVAKVSTSSSTSAISSEVAELKDMVRALLLDKKNQSSAPAQSITPAPVKAVKPNCVTCGGLGTLPSNTITNPKEELKGNDECLALADLGASINLMPIFMWEALSLPKLTPTCMTLELANCSVSKPIGIAKDVSFKVGVFYFPADFVVVDFEPDPRVSLILGRCFLKTGRALIDVHKGELTLRIGNEAITYNLDQTVRYSDNYNQITANKIDIIEMASEEYSQEVLGFSDVTTSGNPTPHDDPIISTTSPTLTLFGDSDFLLFEEANAFFGLEDDPNSLKINPFYYDPEGDILLLEAILNSKPLPPLPNHEKYLPSFKKELKGDNKFPVIIAKELGDEEKSALIKGINLEFYTHKILMEEDYKPAEKTTFTCPYGTFAFRRMPFGLCNAPGTFQRCMVAIFHDMVEKTMEVFMDDFLVFGNSFENCLSHLDKMLQRCEDTNLCLNWEKSHFMVKEGIVLDHKISKNVIEVDRAKVDVIAKLPHPMTVKEFANYHEGNFIVKEKTKRIHNSKIKNRIFNVGDRVLLFNLRLKIFSGTLKTRWSGPFTITKVFPYGMVELSQANGPNFKVNGHHIKHYFGGDVPQLPGSPDFPHEPMNTRNWVKLSDLKQALHGRHPMFIRSSSSM